MELSTASTSAQAVGTIGQTLANIQAARLQAKAAEAEAASAEAQAGFEERQFRRKAAILQGQARSISAASGIDIASGTPLMLELENARQAELEALNIRQSGQATATAARFQARLSRAAIPGIIFGGTAQTGSILGQYAARRGTYNGNGTATQRNIRRRQQGPYYEQD